MGRRTVAPKPMATSMRSAPNFTAKCGTLTALLPLSLVQRQLEEGALRRWGTLAGETERWMLHTSRRLQSRRIRAFVDFLCARCPNGIFRLD